jgi:hypothetical protein
MCFHLGFTNAFIWDKDTPNERKTDLNETKEILEEIRNEIEKDRRRLVYPHEVFFFICYLKFPYRHI